MERFDVFIVGGGGTGSEIAFALGERGFKVGIAERDKLGGECNHYGCVPTKVMLKSAKVAAWARDAGRFGVRIPSVEVDFGAVMQRAREIIDAQSGGGAKPFEDIGIRVFLQEARLTGQRSVELADGTRVEAERIVLATGTEAMAPPIDGLADGPFWTNREAIWEPTSLPESLLVIGSGPIGIEFAQIYARFGAAVTVVEMVGRILPNEDADAAAAAHAALEEDGLRLVPGVKPERAEHGPDGWRLSLAGGETLEAAELLVATGRKPMFDGHDLDAAGVELDDEGRPVLDQHLRTTADGIWAAGDATGELLFTHVGTYEAELVVADILGQPRERDYRVVPRVTFCEPEIGSVGLTEDEAREGGRDIATSLLRFEDNERAQIEGQTHGIVKLVADRGTGELLGGHIVGEGGGEMIAQVALAMAARIPASVAGDTIFAYPTLSESVKGAFQQLSAQLEGAAYG